MRNTSSALNIAAYFRTDVFPTVLEGFLPAIPRMFGALLLSFSLTCLIYKTKWFQSGAFTLGHMEQDGKEREREFSEERQFTVPVVSCVLPPLLKTLVCE